MDKETDGEKMGPFPLKVNKLAEMPVDFQYFPIFSIFPYIFRLN